MKAFSVNIIGLSKKAHSFSFELGNEFFEKQENGLIPGGEFTATVILDKKETFIDASFRIRGHARLECDRSLQPFDHEVTIDKNIVFKYGEEESELTDEIVVIREDRATLDLGQYLYEFIALDLPMKRLHPDFREDDEEAGRMIYTSSTDTTAEDHVIDPRWEQLKKLK